MNEGTREPGHFDLKENRNRTGNRILLSSQSFSSESSEREHQFKHLFSQEVPSEKRLILVVGGYPPIKPHTLEPVCRELAQASGERVALVATATEKPSLIQEAQEVLASLKQKEIAEVILVGHSRGARIIQELALLIEDNKEEINIRGLVLTNPAGIFKQGLLNLVRSGKSEERLRAERMALLHEDHPFREMEKQDVLDVAEGNELRKQLRGKLNLLRAIREGWQIGRVNPRAQKLQVPTFIVAGNEDALFPKERIEEGVKENASRPKVITAKKEGSHSWILFHRPKRFAAAALIMVERYWRNPRQPS